MTTEDDTTATKDTLPNIERLNAIEDKAEWDRFVRLSPQGSIFATSAYLDALNVTYNLYVVRKGGKIDVGLPLVRGLGGFLTNPLFCKYLGIITSASESQKPSITAGQLYRRVDCLRSLLLRCHTFDYLFHPSFDNWLPFYWMGFVQQTLYTYKISHKHASIWWSDADSRLRRSVRSGENSRISVDRLQGSDAGKARQIYTLTMEPFRRRQARAPMSASTFDRLTRRLCADGSMGLWVARDTDGTPVAAAAILYDWHSAYLLMNGTSQTAPTGANSLLIKTIIEDALTRKIDFDFEGSMIRPIEKFYRLFGAKRVCYYRIWKPTLINTAKRAAFRIARRLAGYER